MARGNSQQGYSLKKSEMPASIRLEPVIDRKLEELPVPLGIHGGFRAVAA